MANGFQPANAKRLALSRLLQTSQRRQSSPLAGLLSGITSGLALKQLSDLDKEEIARREEFETQQREQQLQDAATKRQQAFDDKVAFATDPRVLAAKERTSRAGATQIDINTGDAQPEVPQPFSGKLGEEVAKADVKAIGEARKRSAESENLSGVLRSTQELLQDPDIQSGLFAPAKGAVDRLAVATGIASPEQEKSAVLFERLNAASKTLGAEGLRAFGGSDTERELAISLQATVTPDKTPEANRKILEDKLRAVDVLQQRPDFMAEFLRRNGSLNVRDAQSGETFNEAWRRFQKEQFGAGQEAQQQQQATELPGFSAQDEARLRELEALVGGQ